MKREEIGKAVRVVGLFILGWLGVKYLLPVLLPFALGALLALAAEPAVALGVKRWKLPRTLAAGLGVSATLLLLLGLAGLLGALAVKELGQLAGRLPDVEQTLDDGLAVLRSGAMGVVERLPAGVQPVALDTVSDLFSGSTQLLHRLTQKTGLWLTARLGKLTDGVLGAGTGILAGYMISARLPRLGAVVRRRLPPVWFTRYLPALRRSRGMLGGWLKAQGKLCGATAALLAAGFWVLGIPKGIWWALPVALLDALPVLGTGVVLVPWSLVCFLRGESHRGVGLLVLCVGAMILRRILEPKLVGRQLNLDPLATLVLLYLGYRFWGISGMLLVPLLAAAARSFWEEPSQKEQTE